MCYSGAVFRWFNTKVALLSGSTSHGGPGGGKHNNINSNTHASQHAGSSLCDEIVVLWRLAALNPELAPSERDMFHSQVNSIFAKGGFINLILDLKY